MDHENESERECREEDEKRRRRTGIESYEQKLSRWKEEWRREIDEDLERGR